MTENEIRNGLKKISEMLESQEWAKDIWKIPESHVRTTKNKNRDSASGRKEKEGSSETTNCI